MNETSDSVVVVSAPWDDLPSMAGRPFRGAWLQVDAERLSSFDHAAYIDDNANRLADVYPDGLIEGFHQLALLDHLVNAVCFVDDPRWSGWNYGFDLVRFTSVVTTQDRIRVVGEITDVTPRGTGYLVTLAVTLQVEGRDKPASVVTWKVMWVLAEEGTSHE